MGFIQKHAGDQAQVVDYTKAMELFKSIGGNAELPEDVPIYTMEQGPQTAGHGLSGRGRNRKTRMSMEEEG